MINLSMDAAVWLYDLCRREDEMENLQAYIPEIDWPTVQRVSEGRKQEAREAARAARGDEPPVTIEAVNEVTRRIVTRERLSGLFSDTPLLGKLKR